MRFRDIYREFGYAYCVSHEWENEPYIRSLNHVGRDLWEARIVTGGVSHTKRMNSQDWEYFSAKVERIKNYRGYDK